MKVIIERAPDWPIGPKHAIPCWYVGVTPDLERSWRAYCGSAYTRESPRLYCAFHGRQQAVPCFSFEKCLRIVVDFERWFRNYGFNAPCPYEHRTPIWVPAEVDTESVRLTGHPAR